MPLLFFGCHYLADTRSLHGWQRCGIPGLGGSTTAPETPASAEILPGLMLFPAHSFHPMARGTSGHCPPTPVFRHWRKFLPGDFQDLYCGAKKVRSVLRHLKATTCYAAAVRRLPS